MTLLTTNEIAGLVVFYGRSLINHDFRYEEIETQAVVLKMVDK